MLLNQKRVTVEAMFWDDWSGDKQIKFERGEVGDRRPDKVLVTSTWGWKGSEQWWWRWEIKEKDKHGRPSFINSTNVLWVFSKWVRWTDKVGWTCKGVVTEMGGYYYKKIKNLTTKHSSFLLQPHIYSPELNNNQHVPGRNCSVDRKLLSP